MFKFVSNSDYTGYFDYMAAPQGPHPDFTAHCSAYEDVKFRHSADGLQSYMTALCTDQNGKTVQLTAAVTDADVSGGADQMDITWAYDGSTFIHLVGDVQGGTIEIHPVD